MRTSLKYGVSAIALLAAVSLAQAQTSERQGAGAGERGGGKSGRSGQSEHSKSSQGREQGGVHQNGRTSEERGQQGGAANEKEQGGAQQRTARNTPDKEQNRNENRAGTETNKGEKAGQLQRNAPDEGNANTDRHAARDNQNRGVQGEIKSQTGSDEGGRNEATGPAGGGRSRFASISPQQKTRIHSVIVGDSAIHRYRRSDVDFALQVGTRIPNTIEFYDPPAQIVQIDPAFIGYKIVVLDDVVLVVDPVTREIVDVIRT